MQWLNNLKVGTKIRLLSAVAIVALLIVGGVGYYYLHEVSGDMEELYTKKFAAVEIINDARVQSRMVDFDAVSAIASDNPDHQQDFVKRMKESENKFSQDAEKFLQVVADDTDDVAYFNQLLDQYKKYRMIEDQAVDMALRGQNADAFGMYMAQVKPLSDKFGDGLIEASNRVEQDADDMHQSSARTATVAGEVFLVIIVLVVILLALLSWFIINQIVKRLEDFIVYMKVLSDGNFTKSISAENLRDKTEFGAVSRMLNTMKDNIYMLIKNMSEVSEQLAASSEELTASADASSQASEQIAGLVTKVADGAQKQLETTNNTANVVEQISTAIGQVATNTETVANAAEDTANAANEGESSIKKAVDQMKTIETKTNATSDVIGELEEKSKQIGQIVDVISNIAGQTNLLALNAAIEAARAGEAGKGFAVVAEEVRKLAEQSQDAAKQITELISDVQSQTDSAVANMDVGKKEVDTGAEVVVGAGENFTRILKMVRDMTGQIHEISAAIEEITSSVQDVVTAIKNVDEESKNTSEHTQTISGSTQEQAASIKDVATASTHLAEMATSLEKAIRKFKI